jgi:hypothetical protein
MIDYREYENSLYADFIHKTDEELNAAEDFHSSNWGSQRGILCEASIIALGVIDKVRKLRGI